MLREVLWWLVFCGFKGFLFFFGLLSVGDIGVLSLFYSFYGGGVVFVGVQAKYIKTREVGLKLLLFRRTTKSGRY